MLEECDGDVCSAMSCSGENRAGAQKPEWSGQGKPVAWAVKAEGVTCGVTGSWDTVDIQGELFAWSKEYEGELVGDKAEEVSLWARW